MSQKPRVTYKANPSKYVSYSELTKITKLTRSYLRVLKSRGVLPPTVHPEYPVWLRSDIEAWVLLEGRGSTSGDA